MLRAQSGSEPFAGISFSCMGRHVTVGGFEPTSGHPTANIACLSCQNGQYERMHIETAQRRTRCVSGYASRKCANAPRMTELLVTITEIFINDKY